MPAPTKAERARFRAMQDLGCIACRPRVRAPDIHHLVEGYRLGHSYTIPLCEWHHRGVTFNGMTKERMEEILGASLAVNKRAFITQFGTERELLAEVNELLKKEGQ